MSLYRLIGQFLRRHWSAYIAAGAMLAAIALLTVWMPRQIGHLVDGLVTRSLSGAALVQQLALLLAAGCCYYTSCHRLLELVAACCFYLSIYHGACVVD